MAVNATLEIIKVRDFAIVEGADDIALAPSGLERVRAAFDSGDQNSTAMLPAPMLVPTATLV